MVEIQMDIFYIMLVKKTLFKNKRTFTLINSATRIFLFVLLFSRHYIFANQNVDSQTGDKCIKTTMDEQWFFFLVNGQAAGTSHHVTEMRHNGKYKLLATCDSTIIDLETPRGNVIKTDYLEFIKDTNYIPLSFTHHIISEGESIIQKGTISGNILILSEYLDGAKVTTLLRWDGTILFPIGKQNYLKKRSIKPGESYTVTVFLPSISVAKTVNTTINILNSEPVKIYNQTRLLTKIHQTFEDLPDTIFYAWIDANRRVHKSIAHFGNMQIEVIETIKDNASIKTNKFFVTPLTQIEVVTQGKGIRQYRECAQLTINTPAERGHINFPESCSLKVVSKQADGIVLYVKKPSINNKHRYSIPCTDLNMKPYLEDNFYLSINDMKIKQYAFKAVGAEKDAYKAAIKINKFFHKIIRKKHVATGLRTARWVAEFLEGDCSEHAILVAAMARALGISSRIISGLIITQKNTCECHMWTELYVGKCIATDAMLVQEIANALHIKIITMTLNEDEDRARILSKLSSVITSINKITVGPLLNNMK